MKLWFLSLFLSRVSSVLVNTFYPLVSQETLEISSFDASILLESNFQHSGSEILNKIPKISYSNWKYSKRGWIIIAGIQDYNGQFKTRDEEILFKAFKDSRDFGVLEIPLEK